MDEQVNEHKKIQRQVKAMSGVAFAVLAIGTVFYHFVEHLGWLNSIYFSTITLATVGYGDIVPKTDPGKIFTIFYVLIGIGIIATFANLLLRGAVARHVVKNETRSLKKDSKK